MRCSWAVLPTGLRDQLDTCEAEEEANAKETGLHHSAAAEPSDEELDVAKARSVQYRVKGGIPGLEIRRGCTSSLVSWTPVTPVILLLPICNNLS